MREHDLLAPSRVGQPHGPAHDGTIRTEQVDDMWGTDLTSTMTGEDQASIFVTVDHASTECLGIHAARRATRFEALEPLRQGVRSCFGAFATGIAGGLSLRHDRGSQFVADDYQRELAFLGIARLTGLRARARGQRLRRAVHPDLEGEPVVGPSLRLVEDLRLALHRFKETYNRTWIVERHGYQTPAGRQSGAARAAPGGGMNPQRGVSPTVDRYTGRWRKPACLTKPVSLNRAIRTSPTIVRCNPSGRCRSSRKTARPLPDPEPSCSISANRSEALLPTDVGARPHARRNG